MPTSDAAKPSESKTRVRDQEVLDAATDVFFERGYRAATMQDIADKLGMLKGSLYYYTKSKEELLYRIVMDVHAGSEAILDGLAEDVGLSPLDRLRQYVRRALDYNLGNHKRISVYYNEVVQLARPHRREVLARRAVHEKYVADLVREAQGQGVAAPGDPEILTDLILGTMVWVAQTHRPGRGPSRQALTEACANYVIHGIGTT